MDSQHRRTRDRRRLAIALPLLLAAAWAHAAHTCTVAIGNLSFGAYTGTQTTSTATMTVTCTLTSGVNESVAFSAALSTGSGSYNQRLLTNASVPGDTLPYNLYLGSVPAILNTSVWGDGSGSTVVATGSISLQFVVRPTGTATFTVAGAMASVPMLPTPGLYQDIVAGTVTYN